MVYECRAVYAPRISIAQDKVNVPILELGDEIILARRFSHCLRYSLLGRTDVDAVFRPLHPSVYRRAAGELAEARCLERRCDGLAVIVSGKIDQTVILPAVDPAVGLLTPDIIQSEYGVILADGLEPVSHTHHFDSVGNLPLDVAGRVDFPDGHIGSDSLTLGGMKVILLLQLPTYILAAVEVVSVGYRLPVSPHTESDYMDMVPVDVHMFENPIVQDNLNILKKYDMEVVEPAVGYLACGDTGAGKMPEPEVLFEYILREIACEKDLKGKKIMVTAGPTQEAIDPVRYITNHSTGKMGYAIAKRAMLRGADVTLISGPVALNPVPFVKMVSVVTAQDMFEAVSNSFSEQDILIKSAAVADYRPAVVSDEKVKKKDGDMAIALERTTDILGHVGENKKPEQIICGFSMETQNMLENSRKKLKKKHLDLIVANNLKEKGAGFGTDTNRVTLISEKEEKSLELMSKEEVADEILDYILQMNQVK